MSDLRAAIKSAEEALTADCHPYTECMSEDEPCHEKLARALSTLLAAAEAERDRLAEALRAADSVMWMAREYAEAGGRGGPEMREFSEAERVLRAALAGEEEGKNG